MIYPKSWNKPSLTPEQVREWKSWIHELRATDKKQGTFYLCDHDTYCCLGIRCERAVAARRVMRAPRKDGVVTFSARLQDLPDVEAERLGTSNYVPVPSGIYKGRYCAYATHLNDRAKLTFKEIADVLEWAYLDGPRPEFYKEEA